MNQQCAKQYTDIVGLFPAGGQATRIAPLPCSKELYPIGFRPVDDGQSMRPKVVCHYLLEKMRLAGVSRTFVVLRKGKWDIPEYLGDGSMLNMHLAYLIMGLPYGAPYTLDQAFPFVQDALVVFGFPDILFEPEDAFVKLLEKQAASRADLVVGLFPAHQPHKMDMVDLDQQGRLRQIVIKPAQTHLRYTWIIAVWTPRFTRFMHDYLAVDTGHAGPFVVDPFTQKKREPYIGDVIQAAIHNNLHVDSVVFDEGTYLDIGTPDDLARAVREL